MKKHKQNVRAMELLYKKIFLHNTYVIQDGASYVNHCVFITSKLEKH